MEGVCLVLLSFVVYGVLNTSKPRYKELLCYPPETVGVPPEPPETVGVARRSVPDRMGEYRRRA